MRILIVDDEPLARARLRAMLGDVEGMTVSGEAGTGTAALAEFDREPAEVVLLDIRMPGMDGIEVARHLATLEQPPAVIFTTAYDGHALAAFQTHAVGYLLKPIRQEHLVAALVRATRPTRAQLAALAADQPGERSVRTHISASLSGNLRLVPVDEVRFFRAEHKYVTARHPGGELVIEDPLSALEEEFGERFLRVHRNAIVASRHVRACDRDPAGHLTLGFDGVPDTVEVSRRLAAQVRRALSHLA